MATCNSQFHPLEDASEAAAVIVPVVYDRLHPLSVLDLGCNAGWWLKSFGDVGVADLEGVDGVIAPDGLAIEAHQFLVHDLCTHLDLHRAFDLVLCLEVAEHIEAECSPMLLANIARHGDAVLWSAATPGQGGYRHVNERPVDYWIDRFNDIGYVGEPWSTVLPKTRWDYYRRNAVYFTRLKR